VRQVSVDSLDCGWELETGRKIPYGLYSDPDFMQEQLLSTNQTVANRLLPASSQPPSLPPCPPQPITTLGHHTGYRDLTRFRLSPPCFGPPHPPSSRLFFIFPLSSFLSPASFASQASREVTCSSIIHFSLGFFFLISTCSVGLQFCNFRLIKYS
jgi:hypothetical protein